MFTYYDSCKEDVKNYLASHEVVSEEAYNAIEQAYDAAITLDNFRYDPTLMVTCPEKKDEARNKLRNAFDFLKNN